MRKSIALAITAATTAGLAAFVPATANAACAPAPLSCSGDTTVTATIGGVGVISIAVTPVAALVGTTSPATGSLGLTTVTDTQTGTHSWAVSIKSTDFALTGDNTVTIPATNASVTMAAPTAVPATATFSGYPSVTPLGLTNSAQTLVSASASNANTSTFTPSMSLTFSGSQPVGVYTGTVTQTVS